MNETHPISIAIDGPSGAGKSTLAGGWRQHFAFYMWIPVPSTGLSPIMPMPTTWIRRTRAAVLAALPNIRHRTVP